MTRNLKGLGLALVAVFALSGVVASAATAEKPAQITAESYPVSLDGEQVVANVLEREGRKYTCDSVFMSATATAAEPTTITATPTYSNCHGIILGVKFPVTITMNGCDYLLHLTGELNGAGGETFTEGLDVVCTSPNQVEVHIYENHTKHTENISMCTLKIPPQTGLKTISLTNKSAGGTTPKNYVEVDLNVSGITSTVSPTNASCGLNAHNATATVKGTTAFKGTTDPGGAANGITVSTVS
jgi:hypothetical protein